MFGVGLSYLFLLELLIHLQGISAKFDHNTEKFSASEDPRALTPTIEWEQIGTDLDGEASDNYFGVSVSMSSDGNKVIVGSDYNSGNGLQSGHARVFGYISNNWQQIGNDIDGEASDDYLGYSVSMSGDGTRVIVGGYGNDGNGNESGHARVFEYAGNTWQQIGTDLDGEASEDYFGLSVSMSDDGTRVVVGGYGNDGNGPNSGHARAFEYVGNTWQQIGTDIDGEASGDWSGVSVSMSGDGRKVIVGGYGNAGNGIDSGHARVFGDISNNWQQIGNDIDGEASDDYFGVSVSMSGSGSRVIVGGYGNDGNGIDSGHARVFEYAGNTWQQIGTDLDGEASDDYFGVSVSMSGDGTRVVVGGYYNDGNGSDSGHARVFEYVGNTWQQIGTDLDGEASGDYFGVSVSMSGDGNRAIVGGYGNDGNGGESGHARAFEFRCSENPDSTIAGQLSVDSEIFANCGALSSNPQFIPIVCPFDPYTIAEQNSPAIVCANTCGNPSAPEDPFAEFLVLVSGTDVIRANCSILAGASSNIQNFACNLDLSIWIDYTPSVACCETCDGF